MKAERATDRYKAAVIGCGWMGATADKPGGEEVLSHSHSYKRHSRIDLVGVCDSDKHQLAAAAQRWSCPAYSDVGSLMSEAKPDIVAVATSTSAHAPVLEALLETPVKLVIAEKPLTGDVAASERIVEAYKLAGIPLIVNMIRRFDPAVQSLADQIRSGQLGEILHATMRYTKGVLHNGCHAVDLCNQLFGDLRSSRALAGRADYDAEDPTVTAFLQYQRCAQVLLLGGDEQAYSLFELDVVAARGRVQLVDSGLTRIDHVVETDPFFTGYKRLSTGVRTATGLHQVLETVADHLVEVLDGKSDVPSSAESFLRSQRVCADLLVQYQRVS